MGVELVLELAKFPQQTAKSGDDGAFVFEVGPGSYYLLARPNPTSSAKESVTEAPTYYPEAGDLSQAGAVIVGAASAVSGVDIHLRSTPLYRLRGVVVNDSRERVKATVELRRKNSSRSAAWLLISGAHALGR